MRVIRREVLPIPPNGIATFNAGELAVALSHYDLGIIESVTDFPRGSRQSPKVGIVCERGKFLLKRLAAQRANPERVRFAHRIQRCLAEAAFPLPRVLSTRDGQQYFVHVRDNVYELFEFIPGQPFQHGSAEARDAGVVLGRMHEITESITPSRHANEPRGDYHDARSVRTGLCSIGANLSSHDSFTGDDAELAGLTQFLLEEYEAAAEAANQAGLTAMPERIVHADWHPGNLLFRSNRVVAVIDYDSVRWSRQITDVANGALQFSIIARDKPETWPDHLDQDRWDAFLAGYASVRDLGEDQWRCLPHLMIEALIAECVPPINQTGLIGPWAGFTVLQTVRRKVAWLTANHERLLHQSAQLP